MYLLAFDSFLLLLLFFHLYILYMFCFQFIFKFLNVNLPILLPKAATYAICDGEWPSAHLNNFFIVYFL